jgi:hypothetical protein
MTMMSSSTDRVTAPIEWIESLERSKAQIAAGLTVPLLPLLEQLRASAELLEVSEDEELEIAGPTAGP